MGIPGLGERLILQKNPMGVTAQIRGHTAVGPSLRDVLDDFHGWGPPVTATGDAAKVGFVILYGLG